ncbi:hypothetical protein PVL29_009081 [Vitis rotundifolia]|uniref:Uncharacterized protein n=1 Tax=Vitis rotundifolia TaxID=103349 RepID=A0AA38ZZI3_VITRO|nr:hypothetical protein PVL29_009081 [Vitis rotundifolia]
MQESSRRKSSRRGDKDPSCVIHKVPSGDTPYVRAKHAQAIEAIKSCRGLCPKQAQESLDNVLIDLYKVDLPRRGLQWKTYQDCSSHCKRCQVSIKQETSRKLGNLGWSYMQKSNYMAAEMVYKKAQMIDSDANKACNLALCLIKEARYTEAHSVLNEVLQGKIPGSKDCKAQNRAQEPMLEVGPRWLPPWTTLKLARLDLEDDFIDGLEKVLSE